MSRTAAGFYLNASNPDYSKHYNMYNFVTEELPKAIESLGLPLVNILLLDAQELH